MSKQARNWTAVVVAVVTCAVTIPASCALGDWIHSGRETLKSVRVPVDKSADVAQIAADWFPKADTNGDGYVDGEEMALAAPGLATAIKDRLGEPTPEPDPTPDPESGQ